MAGIDAAEDAAQFCMMQVEPGDACQELSASGCASLSTLWGLSSSVGVQRGADVIVIRRRGGGRFGGEELQKVSETLAWRG